MEHQQIILREITLEDAGQIVNWRNIPEVYRYFKFPHPITLQEHVDWFTKTYEKQTERKDFMLLRLPDELAVGTAGLSRVPETKNTVEMSYLVAPEQQRKGYARRAIELLCDLAVREWAAERARTVIHRENEKSLAFIKNQGFTQINSEADFLIFEKDLL